jgi:glycosyltransferase involved in cell wall biosynthesis
VGEIWRAVRDLRYDAIVVQSPWVPPLALSGRAFLLCEFPFTESPALDDRIRLRSFRQILAVSHYTATWIQRRWGRRAVVLYPPVKPVAQERKGPCILGVGRFVGGGRSKRQRELVAMFRRMCEAGLRGWELHLAGFVQDRAYADQVVADAAGLPVRLHFDVGRPELERLYGMSTLFWHAVGLGADVEREPQRMEHFGIVTVEAMSAGCVPVVIDRGGQREIVGSPRAGVLWNSLDECVDATWRLIRDEAGRDAMSRAAMDRASDVRVRSLRQ